MGGSGLNMVVLTVSGFAALTAGLGERPNAVASFVSSLPTWSEATRRAGCATPVARLTPMLPARGLVRIRTAGFPAAAPAGARP